MRNRSFVAVVLVLICLLGGSAAVLAYDSASKNKLADGVTVGGVAVGGLSVDQARSRLRAAFRAQMGRPVVLRYQGRRFVLTPRGARAHVDLEASLRDALQRSHADNLIVRAVRSLTGGAIQASFSPQVRFSSASVTRFTEGVARAIDRPARDATVAYTASGIGAVPSQRGRAVDIATLRAHVTAALSEVHADRSLGVPIQVTPPKVTTHALAARYPTIITVNRSAFTLRLYRHLKLVKSYPIAVGMAGLETPAGVYHVQDKQVDPSWHVPNSAWAGSLAGQTIPPGPADPIKARWMGIYNGAGIHGTDQLGSLGSAASHGCIRMAIPDVIELYSQTPLGTPVYIA